MHSEPTSPRPLLAGILSRFKEDEGCVSLDVSGCDIGDELFPCLSDILSRGLKRLNLSDNHIGPKGIHQLAEFLEGNTSLEELNLLSNRTKCYLMGSADDLLIRILASNTCLKVLDLSRNAIHPKAMKKLLEGLLENTSSALINLNLSLVSIDLEGAQLLSELIRQNKLQELSVSNCGMPAKATGLLLDALCVNTSLQVLDLGYSDFNDENHLSLENALLKNSTLKKLSIQGSTIRSKCLYESLQKGIQGNFGLIELNYDRCSLTDERPFGHDWDQLADAVNSNVSLETVTFPGGKISVLDHNKCFKPVYSRIVNKEGDQGPAQQELRAILWSFGYRQSKSVKGIANLPISFLILNSRDIELAVVEQLIDLLPSICDEPYDPYKQLSPGEVIRISNALNLYRLLPEDLRSKAWSNLVAQKNFAWRAFLALPMNLAVVFLTGGDELLSSLNELLASPRAEDSWVLAFPNQSAEMILPGDVTRAAIQKEIQLSPQSKNNPDSKNQFLTDLSKLIALPQGQFSLAALLDIVVRYVESSHRYSSLSGIDIMLNLLIECGYGPRQMIAATWKKDFNQCKRYFKWLSLFAENNVIIDLRILWQILKYDIDVDSSHSFMNIVKCFHVLVQSGNMSSAVEMDVSSAQSAQKIVLEANMVDRLKASPQPKLFFEAILALDFFKIELTDAITTALQAAIKASAPQENGHFAAVLSGPISSSHSRTNLADLTVDASAISAAIGAYDREYKGLKRRWTGSQDPAIAKLDLLIHPDSDPSQPLSTVLTILVESLADPESDGRGHLKAFKDIFKTVKPLSDLIPDLQSEDYWHFKNAIVVLHLINSISSIDTPLLQALLCYSYGANTPDFGVAKIAGIEHCLRHICKLASVGLLSHIPNSEAGAASSPTLFLANVVGVGSPVPEAGQDADSEGMFAL